MMVTIGMLRTNTGEKDPKYDSAQSLLGLLVMLAIIRVGRRLPLVLLEVIDNPVRRISFLQCSHFCSNVRMSGPSQSYLDESQPREEPVGAFNEHSNR
jgi:hypothetical protein